jgi:hypothetical protein
VRLGKDRIAPGEGSAALALPELPPGIKRPNHPLIEGPSSWIVGFVVVERYGTTLEVGEETRVLVGVEPALRLAGVCFLQSGV